MGAWKIKGQARSGKGGVFWNFHIEFPSKTFWPYNYVFTRENLYFCEELWERGASLFPLKEQKLENTEIFLERDDIIVSCGVRWSFSGQEKLFVEFINLETQAKYRFFPEEVSLIYHTQDRLVCCYKDAGVWKKSEYSLWDFSLIRETQEQISAFFKLLFHHTSQEFSRLVYKDEAYFFDIPLLKTNNVDHIPISFDRQRFQLETYNHKNEKKLYIDVWKASLTWEI